MQITLNPALTLDKATFGDTVIDKTGLSLAKGAVRLSGGKGLQFFAPEKNGDSEPPQPSLTLNSSGLIIVNGPSVTTSGINVGGKKITKVAAGELSQNSTEAVNGGQLFSVQSAVTANQNSIAKNTSYAGNVSKSTVGFLGGNAEVDDDGRFTFSDIGGTGKNTVHDAIAALVANTAAANSEVQVGKNLELATTTDKDGHSIYKITTQKAVEFDQVITGASYDKEHKMTEGVVVDNTGLSIVNGPSVTTSGINVGGKKITKVAAGELSQNSTEAVNGGQLFSVQSAVTANQNSIAKNTSYAGNVSKSTVGFLGGNAEVDDDGRFTFSDIGGTGKNTVHDAIAALVANTAAANSEVQVGKNLELATTTDKDGHSIYKITTQKAVEFDQVITGASYDKEHKMTEGVVVDNTGLSIVNGPSVTTSGINVGGKKITKVAAGELSQNSTEAVNGGQLFSVQSAVTANQNSIAKNTRQIAELDDAIAALVADTKDDTVRKSIERLKRQFATLRTGFEEKEEKKETQCVIQTSAPKITSRDKNITVTEDGEVALNRTLDLDSARFGDAVTLDGEGLRIADGPSVTNMGIDAGGKVIAHVGEGTIAADSSDAVTGGQLFHVREDLREKFREELASMANRLDERITDLDARARSGIASALASAALPQAYLVGESVLSAATANYRGEQALSIGASTVSPSGRWIVKGTANVTRKDVSGALGIGYRF